MAESATVERGVDDIDPRSVGTAAPAAASDRGAVVIANRVGEKIAARVALDVDGVVAHQAGLGSVLGGAVPGRAVVGTDYPQARVDMSQTAPTVGLTVALDWPCAVTDVCREVRRRVADELTRLTGIRPGRVDVVVAQLISETTRRGNRSPSGYVEIPASPTTDGGDR
ncbi:Asp23/Gls24 family envelope stress response protein [Gordonia soli]|uniref:Asp23/Gls24 family envelope stress response protein n=1 Tax=Gordonia soli NBRC 108243 TaxID=1223545 RepID=M0QGE1_9ACTN|nr:Asp23/Gls24 family envelope stress response protein [Gordonia soli]GAC66462.1 hypothetical protein GS4_02_01730 [Gordonia soli NBRC 108243]